MEKINQDIYVVGGSKNTSAIIQFGSKKKGVVHSISKINVNESDDWCNWGDDNQYPKTLMEKVSKVGSAVGFKNRLTNFIYKWSFITEKNKIRQYDIRSQIFCYGRRHLIKSWTKKSLSESIYAVEIETETY